MDPRNFTTTTQRERHRPRVRFPSDSGSKTQAAESQVAADDGRAVVSPFASAGDPSTEVLDLRRFSGYIDASLDYGTARLHCRAAAGVQKWRGEQPHEGDLGIILGRHKIFHRAKHCPLPTARLPTPSPPPPTASRQGFARSRSREAQGWRPLSS